MTTISFSLALGAYLIAGILYGAAIFFQRPGRIPALITGLGFLAHSAGLLHRTIEASHAPFANLYESMVFFSWAIVFISLILEFRLKTRILGVVTAPLAFLSIASASLLPAHYKEITPLIPALQSHWLEIHVIACFLGYAAFAAAFGISILYLIKNRFRINRLPLKDRLDELNYQTIAIGFPFLTLGIITGAIWANYAWGTYWSWDPKETWSLITWFIYAAYLHVRLKRDWRGNKAAWLSISGFAAVIFTYFGVNFILSGLHSYI
ncbi:MAG: c-type cytochrome biogenesis protein CcsB [bacterium]|nr:c-type cytochrome biogenesis protein CcsB [bacterium]